jgi:hypothetical protein
MWVGLAGDEPPIWLRSADTWRCTSSRDVSTFWPCRVDSGDACARGACLVSAGTDSIGGKTLDSPEEVGKRFSLD